MKTSRIQNGSASFCQWGQPSPAKQHELLDAKRSWHGPVRIPCGSPMAALWIPGTVCLKGGAKELAVCINSLAGFNYYLDGQESTHGFLNTHGAKLWNAWKSPKTLQNHPWQQECIQEKNNVYIYIYISIQIPAIRTSCTQILCPPQLVHISNSIQQLLTFLVVSFLHLMHGMIWLAWNLSAQSALEMIKARNP